MAAQRSVDPLTASSTASSPDSWHFELEQRDALIRVALGYQALVRATRHARVVSSVLSVERASLWSAVAEYAALRRSRHAMPEQVLGSVKAVASALSASIDPQTSDILGRVVLQAFLAGYYGEASRPRGTVDAGANVHLR